MTDFEQEELELNEEAAGEAGNDTGDEAREVPRDGSDSRSASRTARVWSVSQVNRAVRFLLEDSIPPVWVSGEVAGWTRARSGHCYFTLKDETAQLRCVLFRTDAQRLPTDPTEGMTVRVLGGLTLYEARGDYQMVARRLESEEGEGLWRLAFERLRRRLDAEGLTADERKRPLPRLPSRVGVVTSLSGAAFQDILRGLRTHGPWLHVVVREARVQGDGAGLEVARAVRTLGGSGLVDVMIVGRGGGSLEDLWAFNEEPVARAIAACPVPVVSAVGHEVDVTIADLVADARAPTPTAAAELVTQGAREALSEIGRLRPALARGLSRRVERERGRFERYGERVERLVRATLATRRSRMEGLAGKIHALSPLRTLERGFAVPLDLEGRVLRSVSEFEAERPFALRVVDGRVRAIVQSADRQASIGGAGA